MGKRIEKVKVHLYENRGWYGLGVGIVLGAAGMSFVNRELIKASINNSQIFSYKPVNSSTNAITQIILPALGDPGDVIRCIEDGTLYASRGQLSRASGASMSTIAKHILGVIPDLNGKTYEVVAKAGLPFFA